MLCKAGEPVKDREKKGRRLRIEAVKNLILEFVHS